VNKWDLVEDKSDKVIKTFTDAIYNRFAPFVDFSIIFASALTKQRILKVLEEARQVYKNRTTRVSTAKLNEERNKPEGKEPDMRIIGQSEGILEIINDISNLYYENEAKINKKLDGGEEDAS
jgi:predicted GTPase